MTHSPPTTIAIDGPAASGKTTVALLLAEKLGYFMFDTGWMYRAVTWAVLRDGIDVNDEAAIIALAKRLKMSVHAVVEPRDGRQYTVLVDGVDVTWGLRTADTDTNVSSVAKIGAVREEMVRRQREIGLEGNVVMVGRDIGTVVLPDAPLKIYIVASAEERARRRWLENRDSEPDIDFERILNAVRIRDERDSNRAHSPLRPADDAVEIDSTHQTPEEIVERILGLIDAR